MKKSIKILIIVKNKIRNKHKEDRAGPNKWKILFLILQVY